MKNLSNRIFMQLLSNLLKMALYRMASGVM
jgi:hypothetical protein